MNDEIKMIPIDRIRVLNPSAPRPKEIRGNCPEHQKSRIEKADSGQSSFRTGGRGAGLRSGLRAGANRGVHGAGVQRDSGVGC